MDLDACCFPPGPFLDSLVVPPWIAAQILVPPSAPRPRNRSDVLLLEDAFATLVTGVFLLPPGCFDLERLVHLTFYQELTRVLVSIAFKANALAPLVSPTEQTPMDVTVDVDAARETTALADLYAFVTKHAFQQATPAPPGTEPAGHLLGRPR